MVILLDALLLAHLLLRALPLLLRVAHVDVLRALRRVNDECHTVVDDLSEALSECNLLLVSRKFDS